MSSDRLLDPLFAAAEPGVRELRARRERFVTEPTPLQPLDRLRRSLGGGPRLWIKRDDLTGFAGGGNKSRKLEYLVAEARAAGADTLVTVGAAQSNHARQTAAAAAVSGFGAVLVLRVPIGSTSEYLESGNVLLDHLFGAELIRIDETPDDPHPERPAAERAVQRLRAAGRRPFLIPSGGSTAIGALGYLESYAEIAGTAPAYREIVVASGSGGTQAGLIAANALLGGRSAPRIHGVAVEPGAEAFAREVETLAAETLAILGHDGRTPRAEVDPEYSGTRYGELTDAGIEAIRVFARTEGILLDPVYSAKAAAAFIAAARSGVHPEDSDILFLHTGGSPALYAHASPLARAFGHDEPAGGIA